MSSPKIELRRSLLKTKARLNLMAVNIKNLEQQIQNIDNNIYKPSEISHLIAKLIFNTSIYGDVSRLFKVSQARTLKMLQVIIVENLSDEEVIIVENLSDEEVIRQNISLENCDLIEYLNRECFSEINFASSCSWKLCGLEEFLTIPLKSLTVDGAETIGKTCLTDNKTLTSQVLMSTPTEMHWDEVPIPKKIHQERDSQYIFSQDYYLCPDNDPRSLLAIDCEMVSTGDMTDLALARVSIVQCGGDYDLSTVKGIKEWLAKGAPYNVIYDQHVRPKGVIVDYLTKYSGITAKNLENVTVTLDDVHVKLQSIIKPNTILVGHSIQMDLKTLRLYHPYIIDTSTIYNIAGDINRKPGLSSLSREMLHHEIRKKKNGGGHDSIEDAHTALKLTMLKLLKDINYGNKARAAPFVIQKNPLIGEWKEVVNKNAKKPKPEEIPIVTVEMCKIEFYKKIEKTPENEQDIQKKIDKFILLTENPAVVNIPELMFATNKSMDLIVNVNGIIGRQQSENDCICVHKEFSDRDVVLRTIERCRKSEVLVSVLSDYSHIRPGSSYGERLAQFISLKSNIQKIVDEVPLHSVVLVIFPGQHLCESTGKLYWKSK